MTDQPDPNLSSSKEEFLFPKSKYYGKFTPQHLAFNANLQEFANRISLICNLETGGRISSQEAYAEIKQLWKQLKNSKSQLLDEPPPDIEFPEE